MPLFIADLPFHRWTDDTRTPPQYHWTIVLPVLLTEPGLTAPPAGAPVQEWAFDTANRGEAFAWRHHLVSAGLDPGSSRLSASVRIATALGRQEEVPIRSAA